MVFSNNNKKTISQTGYIDFSDSDFKIFLPTKTELLNE